MPGFELEQVDGGQPIDLPFGDTVLGRGPFLGVSDKRVSRNHGLLENVDGQLRLKPTHMNPCFIQASLGATPEPLQKDQWHCLKEGSVFSLLPGKYIYRVRVITEEGTPRNSQGFEEETQIEKEENPKPACQYEETLEYTPQAKNSLSVATESTLTDPEEKMEVETHKPDPTSCCQATVPSSSRAEECAPETPQRKRILPAWMTAIAPAAQSPSTPKAAKRAPAPAAPKPTQSRQTPRPKRARAKQPSSDEEEDEEEHSDLEQKPRKRAKKLKSDTEESQEQTPAPKPSREKSPEDRLSAQSDTTNTEEANSRGRKRAETTLGSRDEGSTAEAENSRNSKSEQQHSENGQQKSKVSSSSSKPKIQRRTPCPYGTSCYRKNPIHFQESSHPGDDDYDEEQSNSNGDDEDDDRPECPYGTDCYRKNPQHKKEFKHSKPPAVPDDGADDEDEDRYEDSFIDDQSEDSDYVPESDDSGKEDVKRLQKEAKAFMKRKK